MAENKKSFILYTDYINSFKELTDSEAGKLIKILFSYVNDENPVIEDRLLRLIFEPIKQQLKRDLKEWEIIKDKKSDAGRLGNLKRWHIDLFKLVESYKMTLDEADNEILNRKQSQSDKSIASVANVAVTVTDTVTVTDNVKEDVIISDKSLKQKSFKNFSEKQFIEEIGKYKPDFEKEMLNNFFKYWKELSPGGKMKFQLEKTWETKLRLEKWKSNQYKFNHNGTKEGTKQHRQSVGFGAL